ncbi:MAG: hydrogenase maturation protease [Gemmatimonadota bacterium]
MAPATEGWRVVLGRWLQEPWAVVGMGSSLRADDGVADRVLDWLSDQPFPCLRGGTAPENLAGPLRTAGLRTILLIDAVAFGGQPGDIRLFGPAELAEQDVSTHGMSPSLLLQYLAAATGASVCLLGVQPGTCALGAPVGAACARAAARVAAELARLAAPGRFAA